MTAALAIAAFSAVGCNTTPNGDPFGDPNEPVQAQPSVQGAIAAVGATIGYAAEALSGLFGNSPEYYAIRLAADNATPDQRRVGINGLVRRGFGQEPPYTDAYAQLARESDAALVRATALRALNRSASVAHTQVYIAALSDDDVLVRIEAAKALAKAPDPEAIPALVAIARDGEQDVDLRIAAVDALRHYGDEVEVVEQLTQLLEDNEFSVAWQARASLAIVFGEDRGFDPAAWTNASTS